jgi:hypothetical protein
MAVNAFFVTSILFLALGLWLLGECRFLVPYRALLLGPYLTSIALFVLTLFVNVFAAVYLVARRLFLKDTGRKLAHLERQFRTGTSVSEELAARLRE